MKFGLIPAYGSAPVETPEYAAGLGSLAEELGFESVWPAEHVVMPARYESVYPYAPSGRMPIPDAAMPDPLIWLTWVGAATRRLRLGTYVVILPQRNPLILAKAVASLDQLSRGRMMLGVGLGWLREEADAVGSGFERRGARASDAIRAMRALWTQPVASYHGEFTHFDAVKCNPRPARPEGVPIHVGGHSAAAARRAGCLGDGFIPLGGDAGELASLLETMRASAREAGRDAEAIEITRPGAADYETAQRYADAGITRMLVAAREPDLEQSRRVLGEFSEAVIRKLD